MMVNGNVASKTGSSIQTTVGKHATLATGMDYQSSSSRSVNVDIGQDLAVKARKHIAIGSGDDLALRSGSASIVMKKDGEVAIKGKDVSLEAAGKIVGKAATSLTRAALRSAHAQRRQSDFIDLLYCHRELKI